MKNGGGGGAGSGFNGLLGFKYKLEFPFFTNSQIDLLFFILYLCMTETSGFSSMNSVEKLKAAAPL